MSGLPRIAVVGAGLIGRRHAELAAASGQLAALVDPDPDAEDLSRKLGTKWFVDLDACLTDGIDGAIIATPNRLHSHQGLDCISHGIPVLVEKPITDTLASAERLVTAAENADVPILVGHHRRHNPLIAAAKNAIDTGRLGQLTLVNAQFWLVKPEDYFRQIWRRETGAGPIFINLIHDIDLLRHLCGEITRITASQSSAIRGFEVEDSAAILLEFENGALGTATVSDATVSPWSWEFASGENDAYPKTEVPCYQIGGTDGSLSIPDLRFWTQPQGQSWWKPIFSETLSYVPCDPLQRQLEHFNNVISGNAEPLVTGRDGLLTLAAVEAVKRSADTGRPVPAVRTKASDLTERRFRMC